MKKTFITLLILSLAAIPAFPAEQVEDTYNEVLNIDQKFFEAPIMPALGVTTQSENKDYKPVSGEKYTDHMPFFKKNRVRIQNSLKLRDAKYEEKRQEKEALQSQKEDSKLKKQLEDLDIKYLEVEEDNNEVQVSNKNKKNIENKQDFELVGGVKEQVIENEMVLDCDEVKTNDDTEEIEAIGHPILILPQQNVQLTADKMVYSQKSNILKAFGNVVLTKDGMPVFGDYIQINMNEENILMDNLKTAPTNMKIVARNAVSDNNEMILSDGSMYAEKSNRFHIITRMIGPDFSKMLVRDEDKSSFLSNEDTKWKISASEINVHGRSEHDIFQIKDAEVYRNDKYLFTLPSFTAYTNKKREYFEANYPEFGSISRFGMFAGPGLVVPTPFGSTLKLIPLINYKNGLGFGGAAKFKSAFNETQFMYGSAADIFVLRGKQQLDENLYLQYGSNAYMDDWFLGRRMPKYSAELIYNRSHSIPDFLAEGKNLKFTHRISAALAKDGDWNMHSENLKSSGIATTRFRYMAQVAQSLYKYENKEKRTAAELSLLMQGSAAVYGTGDTQFIGRIGPNIHTQYKYWMQDLAYFISGYSDNTPLTVYDTYRYGHSNLYIREALRVNKFLSVGWAGSVTLTNDAPNGKLFQENGFYFSIGPDDVKVNLGYDFMRRTTYFTVAVTLDTKNTVVDYDKMIIKDPERLGQSDKKSDNIAFEQTSDNKAIKKPLTYAQVIDIEDPNKESI